MAMLVGVAVLLASTQLGAQSDPVELGRKLATQGGDGVAPCASCHGANGEGDPTTGFPRLAGLDSAYLQRQLLDYRSGKRAHPVMEPIANLLSEAQVGAAAAYYSSLEVSAAERAAGDAPALGAELSTRGDWDRDIPGCEQCHGPGGVGVGSAFPALAAQNARYITDQLKRWKRGERSNDPNGLMAAIASRMTPEDIAAVAAYLESLPPAHEQRAARKRSAE